MVSGDSGIFFVEKFVEKNFITHSKLGKKAKSTQIASSEPIEFAFSFELANEISQIRSILSFLMRLLLTLLYIRSFLSALIVVLPQSREV